MVFGHWLLVFANSPCVRFRIRKLLFPVSETHWLGKCAVTVVC
ncbi:hypothetical protein Dbac_0504 [Desulfomicrobium baculatum DSM 4028]|uniref:Uncharacterized protein n=1 Tax=Desulfomicrobium baculatum (strain DSM 4028 / VKM B-1378 / X) TaxID=525897 RepID=C7LWD6_DESBD|nr:hypothetical protein Dbac_0504 [Desulfomicrobium baculatum DSM 4028]